jgi:hypothetical protein
MKMKKLLLLVATTTLFISCSKSDDDTNQNASIDGTWKLTAFTTVEPCDFNNDGALTTNFMNETGCYNNSKIVFSGSNTVTSYIQELDIQFDITIGTTNGYLATVDCETTPLPDDTTWSQSGNTVTIGVAPDNIDFTLSGNTLTAVIPDFVDVQTLESGVVVTSASGATLVFTKQFRPFFLCSKHK